VSKIKNARALEPIANKLRPLFQRAYDAETAYILILVVYEIMGIYDTLLLAPLVSSILAEYLEDSKPIQQLEQQAWQEVRQVHAQLREYTTTNAITARQVIEELDCFEAADALPMESGLVSLPNQYGKLTFALLALPKDSPDYPAFVGQFAVLDSNNEIDHFTFAPSLALWENECQKFLKIKPTRLWHSWDILANSYLVQDPEKASKAIDIFEFKHHLQRLEHYTMDWLQQRSAIRTTKSGKPIKPTYDAVSCILKVNGAPIEFEVGSIRAKVLKCFFKNGYAQPKQFSLEELYAKMYKKKVGYFTIVKSHKDALYGALDGINSRVSDETEFLVLKKSKISINPMHLK
jgi:hypothetical protein